MSDPFVGEIRMFAGNFAPRGWAFCDGQLLPISQNDALFSLFGTIYGGDGRTTFALPDMRGRIPVHMGSGPGLTTRQIGSKGGQESVNLTIEQIPEHAHDVVATTDTGASSNPVSNRPASASGTEPYGTSGEPATFAPAGGPAPSGGSQAHNNLMPSLCVNFIVALMGIYPSRQ